LKKIPVGEERGGVQKERGNIEKKGKEAALWKEKKDG